MGGDGGGDEEQGGGDGGGGEVVMVTEGPSLLFSQGHWWGALEDIVAREYYSEAGRQV